MTYSTVANVRTEAGFNWNTDIPDATIEMYVNQSNWIINWMIGRIYDITKFAWSNFIWSQAEYMLARIEQLLSTWYLLLAEYWPEARDTDKDWQSKIDQAMDLILSISKGDTALLLLDGSETPSKSSAKAWWPVLTTAVWTEDPYFSVNDKY